MIIKSIGCVKLDIDIAHLLMERMIILTKLIIAFFLRSFKILSGLKLLIIYYKIVVGINYNVKYIYI